MSVSLSNFDEGSILDPHHLFLVVVLTHLASSSYFTKIWRGTHTHTNIQTTRTNQSIPSVASGGFGSFLSLFWFGFGLCCTTNSFIHSLAVLGCLLRLLLLLLLVVVVTLSCESYYDQYECCRHHNDDQQCLVGRGGYCLGCRWGTHHGGTQRVAHSLVVESTIPSLCVGPRLCAGMGGKQGPRDYPHSHCQQWRGRRQGHSIHSTMVLRCSRQ